MSDVTNITWKRLQEEFATMSAAHLQLKTFFCGDFLNIVSSKKIQYCSLLMNSADGVLDPNYINFRLELACMDKTFNDDSNRADVESDTLSILQDIFGVITMSKRWQSFSKVTGSAPVRKFVHKGEDVVTGWSMSLNLAVKRKNGICNIPIEDYDYQGDYTQYCAGVRIFEDGILVAVRPSGGRYDYSTAASINIYVNDVLFYEGATSNKTIDVVGSDDLPKGGPLAGKWQIADSDVTFNTVPVEPVPSELSKSVVVQTLDAAPIGTVIEDTPSSLKIEIPNAQVNVNSDAFESIAPGSVLNVPVVDAADNVTGTNTGPKIVIASSLIDVNGAPLIPVRAQQPKSIILLDAIDADPVSVIIATNTESLAEIIVPNGLVNIKNSANTTLHAVTVKAGGTVDQPIADKTGRAKNSAGTVIGTAAQIAGVDTDVSVADIVVTINGQAQPSSLAGIALSFTATNIIYFRPQSSGVTTSYLTGDEGYNLANYPPPAAPVFGIPAFLDPTDPKKLLNNNYFGNKQRFTGLNGGYWDYATSQYKLSDGTVSDQATTFGTVAANTSYLIDNHTGAAMKWNIQGSATWSSLVTTILGLTHNTFTDYWLGSVQQQRSLFCFFNLGTNITSIVPINSGNSCKTSTPTLGNETTQHHQLVSVNIVAARADATNDAAYAFRWHF